MTDLEREKQLCMQQRYQEIQAVLETVQKDYSKLVFDNQEESLHHKSYMLEQREMTAIEYGNVEMLKETLMEEYTGKIGTVYPNDKIRNWKDIAIIVIAISSRAAIRGGLLPEISYSLSDSYINHVEESNTVEMATTLARAAQFEYCRLIHEIREAKSSKFPEKYNLHTYKCKNYIFLHLHQKLTVREIADHLNLNADYLSNIFRKYEGVTISRFILREKIKQVKNLLIYSGYSYSEIASYFGFVSQSHLGSLFKKETGYTLGQFRRVYGADVLNRSRKVDS